MGVSHSVFMKYVEKTILDGQILFWVRKSDNQPILSTGAYKLYEGKRRLPDQIDWYEEARPQYTRHANLKTFCKRHELIGKI